MRNLRDDDYEYQGLLLEGIQGSLIEERRSNSPKSYHQLTKKLSGLNRKYNLQVSEILTDPSSLNLRLAEIATLYPNYQVDLKLKGIGKIMGKNQYNKVKNMIIYLSLAEIPEYLKFIIESSLLKLVPKGPGEGIKAELQFLSLISQMEKSQRLEILNKIYSDTNLKSQRDAGYLLLCKNFYLQFFDSSLVKVPQRKRGYNDKGSTSLEHEKERKKSMAEIERLIEDQRQRILLKQMELFERNLDRILAVNTVDSRKEVKEIIRNQNEELSKINNPQEEKEDERAMER